MLESKHTKDHLKLWDIHYGQQFCYTATVCHFPHWGHILPVSTVFGASLRPIHRFPQELWPSQNKVAFFFFIKCQLYFLTFAFLLCSGCDAVLPPKNILALFKGTKRDGMCACQDVTFSNASQYWQPQLLSCFLTTPIPSSIINMTFLLYTVLQFVFLQKTLQPQNSQTTYLFTLVGIAIVPYTHFSIGRKGKSKHHGCYSECLMPISVLTAMKPICTAVWDSRTTLVRHGTPLLEQDVAEGTDQKKEVLRRSKSDVPLPSLHASKRYQN